MDIHSGVFTEHLPTIGFGIDQRKTESIIASGSRSGPQVEAAKVIENIQQDLNIALVNELSLIFSRMGLDTTAVLEAAGTKWNFHPYRPGLVGGHCIPVDLCS